METNKSRFHKNPTIDPKTGDYIDINSKRFKRLVKKYGDVKIVSPQSGREISVGKSTYNKLLKGGYSVDELFNSDELLRDELYTIMINADYETIKNLCLTNKLASMVCNDEYFWKIKLNIDYPNIKVLSNWKKEYYKLNNVSKQADKTIEYFYEKAKNLNDDMEIVMSMYIDNSVNIESIIPKYKNNNENPFQYIIRIGMQNNGTMNLEVFVQDVIYSEQLDDLTTTINIMELKDILLKVLYYYPQIKINYTKTFY